jgi:hypothetical protein
MDTLNLSRESKIIDLTSPAFAKASAWQAKYASTIATESKNMTIPPQFGVGYTIFKKF